MLLTSQCYCMLCSSSLFHNICLCVTINPTIMSCHQSDIIRQYCHGSIYGNTITSPYQICRHCQRHRHMLCYHCQYFLLPFSLKSYSGHYTWDNIAHIKMLCSVALDGPDNNVQEKNLFNVVLILLRQHCTGQNTMQCCLRGSKQHCIGKILCKCCLNTHETTLHSKSPMQCCLRGFRQHYTRKILCNVVLILMEQHCRTNSMQCCPRDSRQHCTGKNPGVI